jgi:hypothetical protein
MVVQPIDVCASDGSLCAPFNLTSRVGNPGNQNQATNPIGFVDSTTKNDITRAMLNQFGVDVTYLPIARYNSPINQLTGTTFQTLNVIQDATNTQCPFPGGTQSGFTSCDFLTLSQQPEISMGTVRTPTNPIPAVPIGAPGVVNLFFVRTLNPPVSQIGGTLYGFSWIANNAVAIGGNTFFPPAPLRPRFDTLAHEFLHNLGATHNDFGAGTSAPTFMLEAANLVSAGCCAANGADLRIEPSSPGCLPQSSTNPNGGALFDLDQGLCPSAPTTPIADRLTLNGQVVPSQQDVALGNGQLNLLGSGLLSNVPNSMVMAMSPVTGGGVAAATTAGTNSTARADSSSSNTINFSVSGPDTGTLMAIILVLPDKLKFAPQNPFMPILNGVLVVDAEILHGNSGNLRGVCPPAGNCLLVEFAQPGLRSSQTVKFSIGIRIGGAPIIIDELAGRDITFIFGPDTYMTTSALTGPVSGVLTAGSLQPDTAVPTGFQDPSQFAGTGSLPCTPIEIGFEPPTFACPNPAQTGIQDGNVLIEGGQLPSGGGRG